MQVTRSLAVASVGDLQVIVVSACSPALDVHVVLTAV
jgi:hypothetical protein